MYYEINESRAKSARQMWSFSDYIPNSTTDEYRCSVDECYRIGEAAKARSKEDKHGYIDYLCDKYARKLAEYYNKDISINLMCPSLMICGPSNFPVRKKEKQNAAGDRNRQFYNEIEEIKHKLKWIGTEREIIKSNDPLALELLQDKVDTLTDKQEEMKSANAYYRKHKTMVGYAELTEDEATRIDTDIEKAYSWEKQPYPAYELTNNNACIKSTKERLARLSAVKERGTVEKDNQRFKVVENVEEMRLQLIFDSKPSDEIRCILKSNGYKWSPRSTAWQRQLTPNARYSVTKVLSAIESL